MRFPTSAEEWDRAGFWRATGPCGDRRGACARPDARSHRAAVELGANVLVTHHPAFLRRPNSLTPGRGAAGVVFAALDAGVALINAHTNLDRAPPRAGCCPRPSGSPIKPGRALPCPWRSSPSSCRQPCRASSPAMAGAAQGGSASTNGARLRRGHGGFTSRPSRAPFRRRAGGAVDASEVRVEMVALRRRARGVVAAARGAHPYEEPLVTVGEVESRGTSARMGMLNRAPEATTLGALARARRQCSAVTPRVWGDPEQSLIASGDCDRVGGSLIGDALASRRASARRGRGALS